MCQVCCSSGMSCQLRSADGGRVDADNDVADNDLLGSRPSDGQCTQRRVSPSLLKSVGVLNSAQGVKRSVRSHDSTGLLEYLMTSLGGPFACDQHCLQHKGKSSQ